MKRLILVLFLALPLLSQTPQTQEPSITSRFEAQYTPEARANHIEGTVVLDLIVGVDGRVYNVTVKDGLGYGLDEAAIQAAGKWTFQPATKDSHAVAVNAVLQFKFALSAAAAKPTRIGKHQIGETIEKWAALTDVLANVETACHGRKKNKRRCEYLTSIQDGSATETSSYEINRAYRWMFSGGRLCEVHITPNLLADRREDRALDFQEQVEFLRQAYGPPQISKTIPYHNAYGAQWETQEFFWTLSDGCVISAFENTDFTEHGKLLAIFIETPQKRQEKAAQLSKPNPYQ